MAEKKVALITGANKGLGLEIARQLGVLGNTVILAARDLVKAESAAERLRAEGVEVSAMKLDVTQALDIQQAAGTIQNKYQRLDILVNNAGVIDQEKEPSVEAFRHVLETNLVGQYAVTMAMLPLLKKSSEGRVVNQSSMLGSMALMAKGQGGDMMTAGYSSSKAALNMLTVVLAGRLKGTDIKVNSAHPGWVKTDMGGAGANMEITEGAKTAVWLATLPADGPTGGFFHMQRPMPW